MESLVLELQRMASDDTIEITTLLRKALIVSSKLNLSDFEDWIKSELNGYRNDSSLPEYRKARAEIRAAHPVQGFIPFVIDLPQIEDELRDFYIQDSVRSIIDVLEKTRTSGGAIHQPLSGAMQRLFIELQQHAGSFNPLPVYLIIGRNQMAAVIDSVKTAVLEWALKLERNGILGENMTFSEEEKSRASAGMNIYIENFNGAIGEVRDSIIKQNMKTSIYQGDVNTLTNYLRQKGIGDQDLADLDSAIKEDPPKIAGKKFGERVSTWLEKMKKRAAEGTLAIGVEVAGQLLSSAILKYYGV